LGKAPVAPAAAAPAAAPAETTAPEVELNSGKSAASDKVCVVCAALALVAILGVTLIATAQYLEFLQGDNALSEIVANIPGLSK
jgi:hypothetical protein